jgi:hypothetical protein
MNGSTTATPGRLDAHLPFVASVSDHKQSSSLEATLLQDTPTFDFLPAGSSNTTTTTQPGIQQNGTV